MLVEYFTNIMSGTNKYCYGLKETLQALETGIIETLIVWEGIDVNRYCVENKGVVVGKGVEAGDSVISCEPFLDWLVENYSQYGATLKIVSNNTQEGNQFVCGFG